jgi:hypothetical protein
MQDHTTVATRSTEGKVLVVWVSFERRAGQKVSGESLYVLFGTQFLIGREEGCELRIMDDRISRKHSLIKFTDEGARLTDLGSTNGSYHNGALIEDEVMLMTKDKIDFGHAFTYRVRVCQRAGKLSSVRLSGQKEIYLLASSEILIGRFSEDNHETDLLIYDPSLELQHCRVEHFYNDNFIIALSPKAAVKVNGKPVKELGLKDDDLVEIGDTAFRWKVISLT